MANFVVVVDADFERRSRFIEAVEPLLPPVEGLNIARCAKGDFCAIWAASKQAPISQVADDEGAAVVWGEAIAGPGPKRINATELRQVWKCPNSRASAAFDGFYAAVVYHPKLGMVIGADLLGLFPIYYYASGNVLLVGSSPELFRHHPVFRMEFNPRGLVGILLTMHIIEGQTLLRGVQRLAAGHVLAWSGCGRPKEERHYAVPVSDQYYDLPFSAHVQMLKRVLDEAIARHAPVGERYGLLLSGGLDSRLLGGLLKRKGSDEIAALTFGWPTDIEMRCAIPVARTLGFQHQTVDVTFDQYPAYAELQAKWQHVANGFNGIMEWGDYPHLRELGDRVVSGYLMDAVIGGSHINWALPQSSNTMSFERFFYNINSCGIPLDILKKLLRREVFGDLVDEMVARLKTVYESYGQLESQRAWCFNLYHRQRFHVASAAWVHSFGAWPVMPVLDRALLEVVGAMPAASLAERRAQVELLCSRFPELAALSLDRNSYDVSPLQPRLRWRLAQYFRSRLPLVSHPSGRENNGGRESRYYYRIYDLNGAGWQAVRDQAEPYRECVRHLFDQDVLSTLLPPPDVPLQLGDAIIGGSGLKSLLGFLLWSKEHLA